VIRRLVVLAALVATAFSMSAGLSSAKVIQKCVPNVRPGSEIVNGVALRIFCGTANATIHVGGVTSKRSNGACYSEVVGSMVVGIGKFTKAGTKPLYPAMFMAVAATKDGTFNNGVLTFESKGKTQTAGNVRVVVRGKRTRGTFSGKFLKGPKFTGSFTCK
jgi:hypothetical protein